MRRLCVDFVGPWPASKGKGNKYLLTVLDTFSRWLEAFPTKTCSAEEVAEVLVREVFSRYGLPEKIHSDRGSHFTAKMTQELAKELRVDWEFGPAYHPQSNNVESHHRALNGLINKLCDADKTKWEEVLPVALFVHRTSVCRSTNMAPYSILFGREAVTTLDLLFRDPSEEMERAEGNPSSIRDRIQRAYEWARENISGTVARARRAYTGTKQLYKEGDYCWLFTPTIAKGDRKKTAVFWSGPWKVVRMINPLVYEIAPRTSWLRRNNQVVTIDRMKIYNPENVSEEEIDRLSKEPPPEADLTCAGDEFLERFQTLSETNEEPSYDYFELEEQTKPQGPLTSENQEPVPSHDKADQPAEEPEETNVADDPLRSPQGRVQVAPPRTPTSPTLSDPRGATPEEIPSPSPTKPAPRRRHQSRLQKLLNEAQRFVGDELAPRVRPIMTESTRDGDSDVGDPLESSDESDMEDMLMFLGKVCFLNKPTVN